MVAWCSARSTNAVFLVRKHSQSGIKPGVDVDGECGIFSPIDGHRHEGVIAGFPATTFPAKVPITTYKNSAASSTHCLPTFWLPKCSSGSGRRGFLVCNRRILPTAGTARQPSIRRLIVADVIYRTGLSWVSTCVLWRHRYRVGQGFGVLQCSPGGPLSDLFLGGLVIECGHRIKELGDGYSSVR